MKQWNRRTFTRGFGEENIEAPEEEGGVAGAGAAITETTEADYSFEGYSVEFIDKVALMPIPTGPRAAAQSRRL